MAESESSDFIIRQLALDAAVELCPSPTFHGESISSASLVEFANRIEHYLRHGHGEAGMSPSDIARVEQRLDAISRSTVLLLEQGKLVMTDLSEVLDLVSQEATLISQLADQIGAKANDTEDADMQQVADALRQNVTNLQSAVNKAGGGLTPPSGSTAGDTSGTDATGSNGSTASGNDTLSGAGPGNSDDLPPG